MYDYKTQRKAIFTENGQIMFLAIRDKAKELLAVAGAFREDHVTAGCGGGDSWDMLACVDRLVELGEIICVNNSSARQYWVYISARR